MVTASARHDALVEVLHGVPRRPDNLVEGAQRYRDATDYREMLAFVGTFQEGAPSNEMVPTS